MYNAEENSYIWFHCSTMFAVKFQKLGWFLESSDSKICFYVIHKKQDFMYSSEIFIIYMFRFR